MVKQKFPARLMLCQRNPHGHFEQFQSIFLCSHLSLRILHSLIEPKHIQEGRARGFAIQGFCRLKMSFNLSRPVTVVASQSSVKSRLVGVVVRSPCLTA